MEWNYLSIPKLQRLHRWSLGMDKWFHPILYNGCNYLSMLGLKLNHVSKRGYWCLMLQLNYKITQSQLNIAIYMISRLNNNDKVSEKIRTRKKGRCLNFVKNVGCRKHHPFQNWIPWSSLLTVWGSTLLILNTLLNTFINTQCMPI